jgi:hypothetical protein
VAQRIYTETFDDGLGGWFGWTSNQEGPKRLIGGPSVLTSRSPWWIDYNHAPPGAGYLHMIFCLLTKGAGYGEAYMEAGGQNRFIESNFPTDFRGAQLTVRLRGELENRGAQLVLLVQGAHEGLTTGWAYTGAPIPMDPDWSEHTILLSSEDHRWTCLGSRHDRMKTYGRAALDTVLGDVNSNILFILFPLTVAPIFRSNHLHAQLTIRHVQYRG